MTTPEFSSESEVSAWIYSKDDEIDAVRNKPIPPAQQAAEIEQINREIAEVRKQWPNVRRVIRGRWNG